MPYLSTPQNIGLLNRLLGQQRGTFPGAVEPSPMQPGGFMSGVNAFLGDNPNMMMGAGMALLDKRQNATVPFSDVFRAGMVGQQMDMQRGSRNVTKAWLQRNFKLSEQDAQAALANPAILSSYIKPQATADQQNFEYAQQNPEFSKWQLERSRAGAAQTSIVNAGPKAYDQEVGKYFAGDYGDTQKGARQAINTLQKLDKMEQLLSDPNVYQGAGGEKVQDLKKYATAMGMNVEGVAEGDLVRSIGNEMALQLRNPAGGAGMPGAMSDSDRSFLTSMPAGLTKTPEGNKLIIEYNRRLNQRSIEVAQLMNQYVNDPAHGKQLDAGFSQFLLNWSEAHPLFSATDKQSLQQLASASDAQQAPASVGSGLSPQIAPAGGNTTSTGIQWSVGQ